MDNIFSFIFQDWRANKGNPKGRFFLVLFRAANFCARRKIFFYLGFPYLIFYKIFVQWFFTLEIPWKVQIGKNLSIFHGQGLIINYYAVIGENCTLRHCTTIGTKENLFGSVGGAPVIGNNVDIGNNTCIIGNIRIGDNVKIGCGSIVVKNVEANVVIAGNPAIILKSNSPLAT